jgi:hypothetical protein
MKNINDKINNVSLEEKKRCWAISQNIPLDSKCSIYGTTKDIMRHHYDYNKPLEVITVCRSCHALIHKIIRYISKPKITRSKSRIIKFPNDILVIYSL